MEAKTITITLKHLDGKWWGDVRDDDTIYESETRDSAEDVLVEISGNVDFNSLGEEK